jgi:diguanylate cyclase (GGDEF)-like protein
VTRDAATTTGRLRLARGRLDSGLPGDDPYVVLSELIRRTSAAAELDDGNADGHPERIGRTSALVGRLIALDDERCELLRLASQLHDIGRIGLPDAILSKPGPLTALERRAMEQHTEIGYRILSGSGTKLLELAATIALTHHERYDGGGYPRGLGRDAIPLEGRIVCVTDVFDALTSDRAFRPAFEVDDALRLMQESRGAHFDPLVLDAFAEAIDEVAAIGSGLAYAPGGDADAGGGAHEGRSWRRRRVESRAEQTDALAVGTIENAVDEALAALRMIPDDRRAIDAALTRIRDVAGKDLLPSIYVLEHDRLWCVAQKGYDQIRDGFPLDRGIMARAVRTGELQFVPDVTLDPDFVAALSDLHSEIAVPVGDRLGVLNIETHRLQLPEAARGAFDELARALAGRVESMRDQLGLDVAGLARLFVYASSLRGTSAIAEFSTRTLGRMLDLESAQLSIGQEGTGFTLASFWRRPDSALSPLSSGDIEHVERLVEPGETALAVLDLDSAGIEQPADGLRRWLVWLPLLVAGDEVGVLVGWATRPLSLEDEHIEAATLFAPHAAALIDVAQALRREQRAAVTDSLTGLLNRRGLEKRFLEEIERAERAHRQLAVIIVDCDGLKAINDRGGHELGDSVLLHVARCLKTQKRAADVAGRLGGDEFAVLMPEIDQDGALAAAERLRLSLVDEVLADGQLVTATFGVATYPADGRTAVDLLRAADQALYWAKTSGRNRSFLFDQTLTSPA